jgi:hypothetical protein
MFSYFSWMVYAECVSDTDGRAVSWMEEEHLPYSGAASSILSANIYRRRTDAWWSWKTLVKFICSVQAQKRDM